MGLKIGTGSSPLRDPNFIDEALAGDQLAKSLNDGSLAQTVVTSERNGNQLTADESIGNDLMTLPYAELERKYGREIADQQIDFQREVERQGAVESATRTPGQIIGDSLLSVGSGFANVTGSLASTGVGLLGAANEAVNGDDANLGGLSIKIAETTENVTGFLTDQQSDELTNRKELNAIEGVLDAQDNQIQRDQEVADGANPTIANFRQVGRDILDTGGRLLSDGAVAGDVIAQAIGSLGPSAKLAQGGAKLLGAGAVAAGLDEAKERTAQAIGAAGGVGVAEASGTYSDTVNQIMAMDEQELLTNSPHFLELVQEGIDPQEAKLEVARVTGQIAFARQLPVASALGLLSSKFEASPIGSFADSSLINGFRQIGAQTLEEGLQGASGTYNQNAAIKQIADDGRSIIEGVGEATATGAIAGAGMAAALSTPAAVSGAARTLTGQTSRDILADVVSSGRSASSSAVETISQAVKPAVAAAKPVVKQVTEPVVQAVQDIADRPNTQIQSTTIEAAQRVVEAVPSESVTSTTSASASAPGIFSETNSDNLVQSVSDILETFANQKTNISRLTDAETLYVAEQVQQLRSSIDSLPESIRDDVQTVLASPDFKRVQKRMTTIDLNTSQTTETEVTSDSIGESVRVAKLNPTNVNPEFVQRILKHSGREDLSEEDVRLLTAAGKIAEAVNNHKGEKVQISKDTRVALSQKPAYQANSSKLPKELGESDVSRSIQVGGFTDARGKNLRSVNDFAAEIFQGGQNPDGEYTYVNSEGYTVSAQTVATQFAKFVTHLSNKVEALNQSRDQNDARGKGPLISFDSLVGGETIVPAGGKGGAKPVAYHTSSPNSVQFAKNVANDAAVAANVYNTLVETFPALFQSGVIDVPVLSDQKVDPTTATEEETPPEASVSDEEAETTQEPEEDTVSLDDASEEVVAVNTIDYSHLPDRFSNTYQTTGNEVDYVDGDSLISLVETQEDVSKEYVSFVKLMMKPLMKAVGGRLDKITMSKKDTRTLREALTAGEDISSFQRFKALAIVDPTTGEYDQNLLSIATLGVLDWLTTARSTDPGRINETLEELGVTYSDLSEQNLEDIMFGVSPRQAAEDIGRQVVRMWNLQVNPDSSIVDINGIVEGVVKEILTVLGESGKLMEINNIPTRNAEGRLVTTQTINVKPMKKMQDSMGLEGQGTIQKFLAPELNTMPSFGEKITSVDQTQSRGRVALSSLERAALKHMQDTPHYVAKGISALVEQLGFGPISKMLGYQDMETFKGNDVLVRSVQGKNLSIERNFDEAMLVMEGARDEKTPVYYPVSISKVGRHQFKGINPQNNKILRAMVTPTHSKLNMTNKADQDAFWLTVAQASGLFKVENADHAVILANIENDFRAQFDGAMDIINNWLRTGDLDGDALAETMGIVDMAELNAVLAVAELDFAKENNTLENFETALSFELDGKTDGPANMMSNFGQGLLTEQDMSNFNRVGFFLGKAGATLNRYFSAGNVDLYEVTSKRAEKLMSAMMSKAQIKDRKMLEASARFAAWFGDFKLDAETGQISMTRNTAKNPMTKTVYGSGVRGVASGIAQDMILEFYRTFTEGGDIDNFEGYGNLRDDISILFGGELASDFNTADFMFSNEAVKFFEENITNGIGQVIADSAKEVIGSKISMVNDALILATNVQTEYLSQLFETKLQELIDSQIKSGKIKNRLELSQRDYNTLVDELSVYAPLYSNGSQTLAVGSFSRQTSDMVLSSNLSDGLRQKATMQRPDLAGVKVIPYISIGRGDAMMMNHIYGSDNAPTDTLPVFDGIDMPASKVKTYADQINGAVMANWDQDVLTDIVQDFDSFLRHVGQDTLLDTVFKDVLGNASNTSVTATNSKELADALKGFHQQNQARKRAFRQIPVSVDHMGGSNSSYVRGPEDDGSFDRTKINQLIQNETKVSAEELVDDSEQYTELSVTDASVLGEAMLREGKDKLVKQTIRVILKKLPQGLKIVTGSLDQVNEYRQNTYTNDGQVLSGVGNYDQENNVIFITKSGDEIVAHELVHVATLDQVVAHYNGETNEAVVRLEKLMDEFMELDFSSSSAKVRSAVNATRQAIVEAKIHSQADALNEFMAWTLTNKSLGKTLKTTRTVSKLVGQALALMKRLMGGIPNDMFSHILFNTKLLDRDVSVSESSDGGSSDNGGDGGSNDNGGGNGDNEDGGLTPSANNYTNFWIDLVKERLQENLIPGLIRGKSAVQRSEQTQRYQTAAIDATRQLDFGGFTLNEYQKQTFRAIHMVLATEMRLNTNSILAMRQSFDHVVDNLTPEMFGPTNTQTRYSTVMELLGNTQNDEGLSDAIAVLLALSQTSKGFRKALDQLPIPESNTPDVTSLNEFLSVATNFMMRKAVGSIEIADTSAKDMLDALAENLIREDSDKEYSVLRGLMSNLTKADQFVSGAMSQLAETTADIDATVRASDHSKLTKFVSSSTAFATSFLDTKRSAISFDAIKTVTHMGQVMDNLVPVREFVSEIIGSDAVNKDTMALLDRTNHAISSVRQAFREELPVLLQNEFTNSPDAEQWASVHRVIGKLDFGSVFKLRNADASMRLIQDPGTLATKVQQAEQRIHSNFSPTAVSNILQKSQQLADFMNGKGAGHQLIRNAYAINKLVGEYTASMTEDIDTLITLYALQGMSETDRNTVSEMYQSDPEAMKAIIIYTQGLNKEESEKPISEVARMNGYKGYIPNDGTQGTRLVIEDDSRSEDLLRMGFVRVGDYKAESKFSTVRRGYYYTSVKQGGTYSQGVLQSVHDTYRGVDATTGLSVDGSTSGAISGDAANTATDALNKAQTVANAKDVLLPVYGEDGAVEHYERGMNPDLVLEHTQPRQNMALMLGAWAGRQVEEKFAQQYNNELIDQLKNVYDNREYSSDNLFVDLSSKDLKDPIYRDTWNVIPHQTKAYITEVFGEEGFMVRKDMINLALGYRDPSILDMWTGKTRVPEGVQTAVKAIADLTLGNLGDGTKAITLLSRTEESVQSVVSFAKDTIVIRSMVVLYMNMQANVVQLATRGVSTKTMIRAYRDKFQEIEQYNENEKALILLDTQIRLAGNNKNRVRILETQKKTILDENARMSIAPVIASGAYKNISEGITDLDVELTSGKLGAWLESQMNKLPVGVQTVTKYGLLAKDTALYKGANKAVQYGDFLAKSIMYDHLLTEQGMTDEQAINRINEEFVNFSVLPGRTRSYLEGIGATWFMTFKIRIMKIAMGIMRENPARALIVANSVGEFGSPVADNLATVAAQDRLDYSLGWDMLFGSPELNPWVNMSNWASGN